MCPSVPKNIIMSTIPDPVTTNPPKTWLDALREGAISSAEFQELEIPIRNMVVGGYFYEGDLGFVFAARGLGKTWLGMFMAKCIASNQNCGPWEIKLKEAVRVLYCDGEMPPADVKFRDRLLGKPLFNLVYINHEILCERTGKIINMSDKDFQESFLKYVVAENFKVVFFDNLSTLSPGMDENKAVDWDQILPFLMQLRRAHISVVFIHHAGRNNQMRGHSKREDPSAWIMRLDSPNEDDEDEGAHFISRFTKWRNASKQPASLEWVFRLKGEDRIDVQYETASNLDIFRDLVESGIDTCKGVSEEMGFSKAYVSKLAKKAEAQSWLRIEGSKYRITGPERQYRAAHSDP